MQRRLSKSVWIEIIKLFQTEKKKIWAPRTDCDALNRTIVF